MKKNLIVSTLAFTFLVTATVTYAMSTVQLECERNAFLQLLDKENAAYNQSYSGIANAKLERRNGYSNALTITDDNNRKEAMKNVEKQYYDRINSLNNTLASKLATAKKEYNRQRDICREQQKNRCNNVQCSNGLSVSQCDSNGNQLPNPCIEYSPLSPSHSSLSPNAGFPQTSVDSSSSSSSLNVSSSSHISSDFSSSICPYPQAPCPTLSNSACNAQCKPPSSTSSSSSLSSSSSSYSAPVCGDGKCEGFESAIRCPMCVEGTPLNECACVKVCEADCKQ